MFQRVDRAASNEAAARRLFAHVDLDPYSPTRGCFDRRFWGWKLVDYPEATYQRAVKPLAMLYADPASALHADERVRQAITAGLEYSAGIQHPNGSFDQAFPYEQSFGATAFLLHSMSGAVALLRAVDPDWDSSAALDSMRKAGEFLCRHDERHGLISNHLAGAAAGLLECGLLLAESAFAARAKQLTTQILDSQSTEGWFPEYGGADPGYQTLCLQFLADVQRLSPDARLAEALRRGLGFIAHFVHPDGSFGGEYGARRTEIFHPGGVARLAAAEPLAGSILRAVLVGWSAGRSLGPADVDFGNLSPVLEGHVLAQQLCSAPVASEPLPCEQVPFSRDFPDAGLFVRGTPGYYAVVGVLTGGVVKVFSRSPAGLTYDDGGYYARVAGRDYSTQSTGNSQILHSAADAITLEAPFSRVPRMLPTPARFVVLRMLNLTVMRWVAAGNAVKRLLVRMLITGTPSAPLHLSRNVRFQPDAVCIEDVIRGSRNLRLESLHYGTAFRGMHMASAGYPLPAGSAGRPRAVDVSGFSSSGAVRVSTEIALAKADDSRPGPVRTERRLDA